MINETTDPLNRTVVLKQSTWEYKILNLYGSNSNKEHGNSHPDMTNKVDWVKNCIENPIYIIKDIGIKQDANGNNIEYINDTRQEYYTFKFDEAHKLKAVKAVVDYSKSDSIGEIVTTHIMSGPIKKISSKGGVVYDATRK